MKKEEKNKGGRPPKDIDETLVYKLGQTLLTIEAIATILDCSVDTLDRRFSGVLQKARDDRRANLSEAMWNKALVEKNTTMQIWLSKQHLGHKDRQPDEVDTNIIYNVVVKEIPE